MFDKLTPPLIESKEISYAHRNMLPRLHLAIHRADARSLVQLEYLAMNAKKGYRVAKAYRPPTNPDRSLLPELAYYEPRNRGLDRRRETAAMTNERAEYNAYDHCWTTISTLSTARELHMLCRMHFGVCMRPPRQKRPT